MLGGPTDGAWRRTVRPIQQLLCVWSHRLRRLCRLAAAPSAGREWIRHAQQRILAFLISRYREAEAGDRENARQLSLPLNPPLAFINKRRQTLAEIQGARGQHLITTL